MNHTVVVKHEVTDSLDTWASDERAGGRRPSTIRLYRHYLERWAATIPDGEQVSAAQIRAWLAWPAWAPATRKSAAGAVRSWLRWAHRSGMTTVPAPDVIEVPRVPKGVPRPPDDAVIAAALSSCSAPDGLAIRLGAECGLRRAEIACAATTDLIGRRLIVHGKGGKDRLVPVPAELAEEIRACPPGFLFPGRIDGHLSADALGRRISRALRDATAHQLRHWFGCATYQSTHDVIALQRAMGHESVSTTQIYAAPADDAMDALASAAATALRSCRRATVEGARLRRGSQVAVPDADTSGHGTTREVDRGDRGGRPGGSRGDGGRLAGGGRAPASGTDRADRA